MLEDACTCSDQAAYAELSSVRDSSGVRTETELNRRLNSVRTEMPRKSPELGVSELHRILTPSSNELIPQRPERRCSIR